MMVRDGVALFVTRSPGPFFIIYIEKLADGFTASQGGPSTSFKVSAASEVGSYELTFVRPDTNNIIKYVKVNLKPNLGF